MRQTCWLFRQEILAAERQQIVCLYTSNAVFYDFQVLHMTAEKGANHILYDVVLRSEILTNKSLPYSTVVSSISMNFMHHN